MQKFTSENEDFDVERYLSDLDDPVIDKFVQHTWEELYAAYKVTLEESMSDLQLDSLIRLGNKDYLINSNLDLVIKLTLFDVICAFCYDIRTTGDHTCESAWTLNKLPAALSCFVEYSTLEEVTVSFTRRVLIYPLYRSIDLAHAAIADAKLLFAEGRKA